MSADDPRYSAEVRRRARELPGAGRLPASLQVVSGGAGDVEQGARIELDAEIDGGRVRVAAFRAHGCPHLLAAASWATERLQGATREELERWDWREAAGALDVPAAKFGRLLVLEDAIRALARNWAGRTGSTV